MLIHFITSAPWRVPWVKSPEHWQPRLACDGIENEMIGEQLEVRLLSAKPTLVCKQHPYAEMLTGTVSGRQFATCAQCSEAHSAQWWTEEAREQELEDRAKQLYAKKVS